MRKTIAPGSPEYIALEKLLSKAAGVEGKMLRSIECRIAMKECVTFKLELLGDRDDVSAALGGDLTEEARRKFQEGINGNG